MNHIEKRQARPEKETIHSGHFMVSTFEAEAQDDFDDLVTVPDEEQNVQKVSVVATYTVPGVPTPFLPSERDEIQHQQLSIEISLTKLFKCMNLAYRQKLTSPKWNRFKGIKLRWKDKIRLNNVIWRCWHMQFIKKRNTLVCQFASPLDVDTHVKPETTILEGKYWKRRAEAVIAEYKKWRKFHIMRLLGKGDTSAQDTISEMDTVESLSQYDDLAGNMLTDEDYLNFMTDTLFSTITSHQPFAFPDCREIARGAGLADFIQPSLGPLQPNLDDFMDTLEPLQDLLSTPRLPPVPEEPALAGDEALYRAPGPMAVDAYSQPYSGNTGTLTMPTAQLSIHGTNNNNQIMSMSEQTVKNEQMRMFDNGRMFASADIQMGHGAGAGAGAVGGGGEMLPHYSHQPLYEQSADHHMQYVGKAPAQRLQYHAAPKGNTQPDAGYNKYNAVVPPSQTAPETVSLLQQPVQNTKYTSTVVIQGRQSYTRDKPRARHAHYSQPVANTHYYTQGVTATPGYESRGPPSGRPAAPQMQYLQPSVDYNKQKSLPSQVNPRSFKMPSPPSTATPQVSNVSTGNSPSSSRNKDQFRSHSLPLGSQLNADWTVTSPAPAPPAAPAPLHDVPVKHIARAREGAPARLRSRSSSGGAGADGGAARRVPPLHAVNSEPALPQGSIVLAQLLAQQHSQSLYKLSNSEEGAGSSCDPKSPVRKGQPSPIGSDIMSPHHSLSPPTSPGSPRAGSPRGGGGGGGGEPRRTHLHAEQKRRYNIKTGFDTLQALIPHLNSNPQAKISKAAMLQKGAEYIKQLKAERNQIKEEMESLRQQIECLNNSISNCHSLLPATGAPVSRARAGRLREMFARHVAARTLHNWKYWLFSVVSAALVESFSACVSCGSGADLVRTTLLWAEQHCSLSEMRPAVLNSLRLLCNTTDILTAPERLPDEARAAVATSAHVKVEPS